MLWNVNNGGGYPFPNGTDIAKYTTSTDFKLLDTNGDGSITQADDPYAPYYPVSPLLRAVVLPQHVGLPLLIVTHGNSILWQRT